MANTDRAHSCHFILNQNASGPGPIISASQNKFESSRGLIRLAASLLCGLVGLCHASSSGWELKCEPRRLHDKNVQTLDHSRDQLPDGGSAVSLSLSEAVAEGTRLSMSEPGVSPLWLASADD